MTTAAVARLVRRAALYRDESSAASAAREGFFQPKDLVWLDSCDKHRNEENKPRGLSEFQQTSA
ncbi:hypothetical protein CN934_07690 [Ensifer sp. MMN_5]|nr:hypothetical protein CN934_07690 [Ensifer sp. MMN_5]PND29577.1 hypothetical protein CN933_05035 [Sinorhizobium sp. M4_45]